MTCCIRVRIRGQPTFGFDQGAKRIEKPSMAVEFLLVLFFQTEDDLDRAGVHSSFPSGGAKNTGGILEDVRSHGLAVHGVFGDTFLIAAHLHGASDVDVTAQMLSDVPGSGLEGSAY